MHRPPLYEARLHVFSAKSSVFPSLVDSRRLLHAHVAGPYLLVNVCPRKGPLAGVEITKSTAESTPLAHQGKPWSYTLVHEFCCVKRN